MFLPPLFERFDEQFCEEGYAVAVDTHHGVYGVDSHIRQFIAIGVAYVVDQDGNVQMLYLIENGLVLFYRVLAGEVINHELKLDIRHLLLDVLLYLLHFQGVVCHDYNVKPNLRQLIHGSLTHAARASGD